MKKPKKNLFSVDFFELTNDDIVEFHNKSLPKIYINTYG